MTAPDSATDDATTTAVADHLRREGWAVLPDMLSRDEIASLRDGLAPVLGGERFGRGDFEGRKTERIYALLAKCEAVAPLVEHPAILALCDQFLAQGYLLSTIQAINIHPGEAGQELHCDDDAGAPPRPRLPQGLSTMWALDDFTASNGATRLIPRSHLWDGESERGEPIAAEMKAGSVLVYLGGVFHGGGPHCADAPRLGVSIIYGQPWLRQFENQMVAVPREVAARYSERIQRMLGYSLWGPLGNVNGGDPIKLLREP